MEMITVPVPVEANFWEAMGAEDLETADELMRPALEGVQEDYLDDFRTGDLIREHLFKYQTDYDVQLLEVDIDNIEFDDDRRTGYVTITYEVFRESPCANAELHKYKMETIRFTLNYENQIVLLHVLKAPILQSEQFDGE